MVTETISVAGLAAEAEIVVDRWGIPHIRAQGLDDVFLAQGFNAARDRLWQIDLWRKRGLGLLAADFGPGFLAQDLASRAFLYRGDMAAEWAAYGPDSERIAAAFVAGVNAFVALTEREPDRLPPEFAMLGTKPSRWAKEDVVRIRSHGLTRNALSEVLRLHVLDRADLETDALRKLLEPPITPRLAPGISPTDVPLEALDLFRLAGAAVTFSPERLSAGIEQAAQWAKVNDFNEVVRDIELTGSNNWAVAADRTTTGRPILASDPHRQHAVPSLRYVAHLSCPGLDVIGAGEPCVPGLSFGHNGHSAFCMTIFSSDQEDVYVHETHPEDPDRYRFGDGWEAMTRVDETITVRGHGDVTVPLRFTRHGPVVHEDHERHRAVCVRSIWFEPGTAPYLASLSGMRAKSFADFRVAMRGWGSPGGNQIYADVGGTIAWVPVGRMPLRVSHDGLSPVPGDGRFEWAGFHDPDSMPARVNPPEGFVATANEMNMPPDWDHAKGPIGFEWSEPSRATRIREVLSRPGPHSPDDSRALQHDVTSMPGRRLVALLAGIDAMDAPAANALRMLRAWNLELTPDSAAAALFEIWWMKHVRPMLHEKLVPDAATRKLMLPLDIETCLRVLENPDERFGAGPRAARDALLLGALRQAYAEATQRMGPDRARWSWGRLHHAQFEHGLGSLVAGEARAALDIGPLPIGGSGSTPMNASYRLGDFRLTHGASFRMVLDIGDWDAGTVVNTPGQSGDPRSPHYRDLAPIWAAGEQVPMLYSRAAVDAAATRRIVLKPA